MTLHWWMHWFWVTALLTLQYGSWTLAAPQSENLQHLTTNDESESPKISERQGRAMYFTKTGLPSSTTKVPPIVVANTTEPTEEALDHQREVDNTLSLSNSTNTSNHATDNIHTSLQWTPVNTTELTNVSHAEENQNDIVINTTAAEDTHSNVTENTTVPLSKKRNNLTRLPEVKDVDSNIEGAAESRIVTEKPLSLETTFLQTRIPPNSIESSRRVIDQPASGGMDTGEIAGISFAALVLCALAGSTAFVLYRRRYLNKPQTLNDKCSNPDSSGYLDDSTIRDNSEEMYSLDNDSFLNSLEAMTIQNYWTDTVKHTKL